MGSTTASTERTGAGATIGAARRACLPSTFIPKQAAWDTLGCLPPRAMDAHDLVGATVLRRSCDGRRRHARRLDPLLVLGDRASDHGCVRHGLVSRRRWFGVDRGQCLECVGGRERKLLRRASSRRVVRTRVASLAKFRPRATFKRDNIFTRRVLCARDVRCEPWSFVGTNLAEIRFAIETRVRRAFGCLSALLECSQRC